MIIRTLITTLIFFCICLPMMLVSVPVVAVLLLTPWKGYTTIFGNWQWGRGNTHPYNATKGYLAEFLWLVWRNPVNNLAEQYLCVKSKPYTLTGNPNIGDKIAGGFYAIRMGFAWEYYYIYPYNIFGSRRCIRARIGWKIAANNPTAAYVLSVNPWRAYLGE